MKRPAVPVNADIVIAGAGVAGLSTAYHLALASKKLRILVLEHERVLGGHASGRNAGMIRQTVTDPFVAQLALLGRRGMASAAKKGWKGLSFRPNGSLLLAKKDKFEELEKIGRTTGRLGISSRCLTRLQAAAIVPLLKDGDFERALFCPSDALVEIGPLLDGFRRQLQRLGVKILFGVSPDKIERVKDGFRLPCGSMEIFSKKVVNAAGAWCAFLAEDAGAQRIRLDVYRRHLYLTPPVRLGQGAWPFVWDLSGEFYFRPEGRGLLLSPCDKKSMDRKTLGKRTESQDPAVRRLLAGKLKKFSPVLSRLPLAQGVSGLRTMTRDGRFVIGPDAQLPGFYWAAGLGGHGVTTCFSAGKLSSDIILGKRADAALARAFSPSRFL